MFVSSAFAGSGGVGGGAAFQRALARFRFLSRAPLQAHAKGCVLARSVLSELLLFRELQTILSAVAFAKGTRGKPVGSHALPKLACWL